MIWQIAWSDIREWHNEGLYHAVLCDPPYEMNFMGRKWDGSGVSFQPEMWAHLGQFLYPGAFGFAFAGARTYHRMACAIEDAGFVLHPMLGWIYGSGFPKATRIDTQIDRAAGVKRPIEWRDRYHDGRTRQEQEGRESIFGAQANNGNLTELPVMPLAAAWEGHRYGLQAMRPALEPIICFQKPYGGKPVDCITETGAGALWIDGARIGTEVRIDAANKERGPYSDGRTWNTSITPAKIGAKEYSGRWPANFALCHLPECGDECAEGCPVKALGEQSGARKSSGIYDGDGVKRGDGNWVVPFRQAKNQSEHPAVMYADTGTAARFFFNADYTLERLEALDLPVLYCPKAARKERDAGLEGMGLRTGGGMKGTENQALLIGSGNIRNNQVRNPHPTVKPLKLTRWLATLLLPPQEYAPRRILVPFAGVGSEMIGAALAGWEFAQGIEMNEEYVQIAEARLQYWTKQPQLEGFGVQCIENSIPSG